MSYLEGLNEKQLEAVTTTEGPLLVLAGAGSGKTRVLTRRIAYLIDEKEVLPSNILALTFTNKAANEMKERIDRIIDYRVDDMWVGTFHSMCVRILRRNIEEIGYERNFVIFDRADQKTLMKDCIKELDLNKKTYDPKAMLNFISSQKDKLIHPDTYIKENYNEFRERQKGEIYSLYQKKLKENNALDFDDLISKTIELFKSNPEVLKFYQKKFRYILVDEYQDTNGAQYELIRLLAKEHKNICVVGDDDQSIYKFRGADIRNILEFEKDYSNTKIIKLEQNYRSTKSILEAANCVIKNNMGRKNKKLWTSNEEGIPISLYGAQNEHDEGNFIAEKIEELSEKDGLELSDFAVFYRTNAQSRVLEEAMMKANIPYQIVGGLKFYDRKEIKDIIAYLRVIQNPVDDISLKRIINVPKRGIGKRTVEKLETYALEKDESIYSVVLDVEEISGLSNRAKNRVKNFSTLITKFFAMKELLGVKELIENIIESIGYIENLKKDNSVESRTRIENIEEFISVAIEYEKKNDENSLEDFLAGISLLSDIDKIDDEEADNSVTLMTLHSAKGLEFPVVFLSGMEEGMFPISRACVEDDELEEERRLCYVGITRAKKKLFFTYTDVRTIYGRTTYNSVSRFVDEVPENLITKCGEDRYPKKEKKKETKKSKPPKKTYFRGYTYENTKTKREDKSNIKEGMKVKHKKWGIGTVVQIKGEGEKAEATIAFNKVGIKKLVLGFAPVEIV